LFNLPDGPDSWVFSTARHGNYLYAGGVFNNLGGQQSVNGIGAYSFSHSSSGEFSFIDFEVYPKSAMTHVSIDFPPNQNIRFINMLNGMGKVVGKYHIWERTFYIGHLPPGIYAIQLVDFDHVAHEQTFIKR
jgi:hypothetical protein